MDSEWFNGWTLGGGVTTALGLLVAIWRRLRPAQRGPTLWERATKWASALVRVAMLEDALDFTEQDRDRIRQDREYLLAELKTVHTENEVLRRENARLRRTTAGSSGSSSGPTPTDGESRRRRRLDD